MNNPSERGGHEEQIDQWRGYLRSRRAIRPVDIEELEDHLREQIATLVESGLETDEAFLIAVKRMGALDALSREFAREHSERLWKQLVAAAPASGVSGAVGRRETWAVLALAVAAGIAVKLPGLFGMSFSEENAGWYARHASLLVLPLLTGYFLWKRGIAAARWAPFALPFLLAALVVNLYPYSPGGNTEILTLLHLPIAFWLVIGIAYAGGRWNQTGARMDFIRFSGELFIYYVLIALGGGVLTLFTVGVFQSIGVDAEWFAQAWILPCGAAGAVLVASWLVEAKQSVIENMAPVLARIFSPLFALIMLAFLATMAWTGQGIDIEREVLIAFDLLLALVLGLLLYSVSARDPDAPPGFFDHILLILVVSALLVDMMALAAIAGRITEFGFTPNRVAALGENTLLLLNLAWSAWLYLRFVRGRGSFGSLERWQTAYLPLFALWAAAVVLLFPPLFGFI
jgi:hypothetical protein